MALLGACWFGRARHFAPNLIHAAWTARPPAGTKVLRILRATGLAPELPEDLYQ